MGPAYLPPAFIELEHDALATTGSDVHVNRTMQNLRTEGFVVTAGRTVTIPDFNRLQALAEFDPGYLRAIEKSASAELVDARQASMRSRCLIGSFKSSRPHMISSQSLMKPSI